MDNHELEQLKRDILAFAPVFGNFARLIEELQITRHELLQVRAANAALTTQLYEEKEKNK